MGDTFMQDIERQARSYAKKAEGVITDDDCKLVKALQFDGPGYVLDDLTPIARFLNLEQLSLILCDEVTDLSPIANLKKLSFLELSACDGVTDLTPLANLTELEHIVLATNATDLAPLANLKKLKKFCMGSTSVSDLTPLANLPDLRELRLYCPAVKVVPESLRRKKDLLIIGP